jgi:hypothetical protein
VKRWKKALVVAAILSAYLYITYWGSLYFALFVFFGCVGDARCDHPNEVDSRMAPYWIVIALSALAIVGIGVRWIMVKPDHEDKDGL